MGFPGGSVVKNPSAMRELQKTWVLSLGLGRCPGGRHGNPLQYSYLENRIDRGASWAKVHRVANSRTRLKQLTTHAYVL